MVDRAHYALDMSRKDVQLLSDGLVLADSPYIYDKQIVIMAEYLLARRWNAWFWAGISEICSCACRGACRSSSKILPNSSLSSDRTPDSLQIRETKCWVCLEKHATMFLRYRCFVSVVYNSRREIVFIEVHLNPSLAQSYRVNRPFAPLLNDLHLPIPQLSLTNASFEGASIHRSAFQVEAPITTGPPLESPKDIA